MRVIHLQNVHLKQLLCDAYDGGIVPSLNNPFASLTASNTSFIGCCRTRNVVCEGTSEAPLKTDRQNETENGANTFIWCEWNGSKTTGTSDSVSDGKSSGGAICMFSQSSASVSVSHCTFSSCYAHYAGGGINCYNIKSVEIVNDTFDSCTAQSYRGGGMFILTISSCVRISGCEFQNCEANNRGGGLYLDNFQVSGTGCIGEEKGGGESACVFECSFASCSLSGNCGGGICRDATYPRGHDAEFADTYNLYLESGNPFYECYTTNADDKRICFAYNYSNASVWTYDQTMKMDWLKDKTIYVSVSGNDLYELCGANTTFACKTVKKAFEMCEVQISLAITLMEGDHTSEATTIEIGSKKISVIGKDKEKCSIGTGALSSPSAAGTLFSVTTGHLGLLHIKVDCNSISIPSPSVVVVSDGSGSLSLEDVVITTSVSSGDYVVSSSVFVVVLSQLSMVGSMDRIIVI
eukprot:MONOS_16228.1-p1 / transcript=MONOS_16228.1 / gene=MONOS_16228 / organism=Monocercomonoides_exilis_PA203 / gene_product=unspecified product / transcript_product=unspecified product / location=Mono_scaffold01576:1614-3434(-) / protein_length=465 / sequence_SO=supercontig / SO=protein_coding / is_pseudo=false